MGNSYIVKAFFTTVCYAAVHLVQKRSMKPMTVCTAESKWDGLGALFSGKRLKFPVCMKTECWSTSLVSRVITSTFHQSLRAPAIWNKSNVIFTSISFPSFLYALSVSYRLYLNQWQLCVQCSFTNPTLLSSLSLILFFLSLAFSCEQTSQTQHV